MYRNLNKGEYKCDHCRESAKEIIKLLEQRKRIVIAFNPDFNTSDCFMSYHISNVTDKYPLH
jgi:hypothetical protein